MEIPKMSRALELAIVLDGTDSMQEELESVRGQLRSFLSGLKLLQRENQVDISVGIVVYRDRDSSAGPVEFVLKNFESNLDVVAEKMSKIVVDIGDPYYREQMDAGIWSALDQLNWSDDDETSRWILVIGDAPPYPEGTPDLRTRSTSELVKKAQEKKIQIYGMVTASGFLNPEMQHQKLRKTAELERPLTRQFLQEVCQATNGKVVDLLNPQEIQYWMTSTLSVRPITEEDLRLARDVERGVARTNLRVATLPYLPLDQMTFDIEKQDRAIAVSRMVQDRLGRISGITLVPAAETEAAFESVRKSLQDRNEDLSPRNVFPLLSRKLRVSLIVWGDLQDVYDNVSLETKIYKAIDGREIGTSRQVADLENNTAQSQIVAITLDKARQEAIATLRRQGADAGEINVLASVDQDTELAEELLTPLTNDSRAQQSLLLALELLERSLGTAKSVNLEDEDEIQAQKLLKQAQRHIERALAIEPNSPFAHYLMANCSFNLSRHEHADEERARYFEHLKSAYELRNHAPTGSNRVNIEIEAEHQLVVTKDIGMAVRGYRQLLDAAENEGGRFALRAHWMLAGIHLGDWGTMSEAPKLVDPEVARMHIIEIMAKWPDSPEAAFYQRCLQESGENEMVIPVRMDQLASSR